MPTRSSTDKSVVHVPQNVLVSHPKPSSDYPVAGPGSTSPTANAKFVTPSPNSGNRSTSKTVPPFVPLPPLPFDAKPKPVPPTTSRHRSREDTQATLPSATGVILNSGLLRSSVSLPRSMGAVQNLKPNPRHQGVGGENEENGIPASACLPRGKLRDTSALSVPVQQSKSGLLKRLASRLVGTQPSSSLRPIAASSKEFSKGSTLETVQYPREHENLKLSAVATQTPGRIKYPITDEKLKAPVSSQNVNGRFSFAAVQGRRTEKREAKAREEQRATDARRAAALAKTGLLPASRRYSIVAQPDDGNDLRCSHLSPFDPFVKDQTRSGGDSDGALVGEGSVPNGKTGNADELTAAEIVVREWRGRNALSNGAIDVTSPSKDMNDGVQAKEPPLPRDSKPLPRPGALVPALHSVAKMLPSSETTETDACFPEALLEEDGSSCATNDLIPAKGTLASGAPPFARPAAAISSRHNRKEYLLLPSPSSSSKVSQVAPDPSVCLKEGPDIARKVEPDVLDKTMIETDRITERRKKSSERKGAPDEKVALSHWCFPAPESLTPLPSETSKQTEEKHVAIAHLPSSGSTRTGSLSTTTNVRRINPPYHDDSSSICRHDVGGKGEHAPINELLELQSPLSPCQTLPSSSPVPSTPPSRQRSSTVPPAPTHSSRTQKPSKAPSALAPALMVSLPGLSPTTSTSTSSSGSSVLPRTPSTSSHGHNHVRVLDAPLEVEEDALLSDEHTALPHIAESRPEVVLTGVKEFGHLAGLADLDSDKSDDGALPPLPPIISQGSSSGVTAPPISELDRRKWTTLFGRRRTTQNDHPLVSISEHNSSVTKGSKQIQTQSEEFSRQQPRRVSSFTNLKRTATSVTAVLTGGALRSPRDCSPLHQATEPPPSSPAPHSNKFGASSAFPICTIAPSPNQLTMGIGLRPRPLNPTMHSRGSILLETHAIEDAESRRLAELAFLD